MVKTPAETQREYRARQKEKGIVNKSDTTLARQSRSTKSYILRHATIDELKNFKKIIENRLK